MTFKAYMGNLFDDGGPNNPEKDVPTRPDKNPDPTTPRHGGSEPDRIDPTRIEQPEKLDPTRIAPATSQSHKWTRVNSWEEALEKMQNA